MALKPGWTPSYPGEQPPRDYFYSADVPESEIRALQDLRAVPTAYYPNSNTPVTTAPVAATPQRVADAPQRQADPLAQQRLQLQQDRLKLEQDRFAQQQADARSRQQASAAAQRAPVIQPRPQNTKDTQSPFADMPNMFDGIKQPAGGGGGGGGGKKGAKGGGGGGGGGGKLSPEQKAREKGRYDRAMDRENRRTSRIAESRDREEYARSKGYSGAREMEDRQATQEFFDKSREARERNSRSGSNKGKADDSGRYATTGGNSAAAEAMYNLLGGDMDNMMANSMNKLKDKKKEDEKQKEKTGPRMTHAYGNPYARLVKARGDLG